MAQAPSIDRAWVAGELMKRIDAERTLAADAMARADSPPDATLSVLYHQIAESDERHADILETIVARYGHTPSSSAGGGIGRAWSHLRDKLVELGSDALDQLSMDVTAKAQSVHWHTAWVHAFEVIGDTDSAREFSAVLAEEQAHQDALQQCFNRMVQERVAGADDIKKGQSTCMP
jgi:bacterioferritin (cytochrome b1)